METKCNTIRWVDEFDIKVKLTKQDIAQLLESGRLRDSIGYKEDRQMNIEIELDLTIK